MRKLIIALFIVGLTIATVTESLAQYCDQGLLINAGWAMDWNKSDRGFDPSRADIGAYYCKGIGFVGPNVQFPSRSDDSFRVNLKGGLNVHASSYVLLSPYIMAGYTHYKTNQDLPEVAIGYGGMINVCVFRPVGVYVDVHKCHYLDEKYIPQKNGPLTLTLGVMVIIR